MNSKRLESFDLLRLFFVLLALTAHFRVAQGAGYELGQLASHPALPDLPYHITITRSSMSALLILFGFMIEYVYARLWKAKGAGVVLERMLTRTFICYLAFAVLASLALFRQGGGTLTTYLGTILFAYDEDGKAFLFKYYTFLIPVTFLLLWVRFKFSLYTEIVLILSLITLAEVLKASLTALPGPFRLLGQNFFGLGNQMGPSVLHSLALVTFGSLAAAYTATRKLDGRAWLLMALGVLSVGAVGLEISRIGFPKFITLMASTQTYRAHNSHVYFAFGITSFLSFWLISWAIARQLGPAIKEWISYYGGNTFIIFFYGNVLLLFTPKINPATSAYPILLVVFLLLSLACVNLYDWASKNLRTVMYYNNVVKILVARALSAVVWLSLIIKQSAAQH